MYVFSVPFSYLYLFLKLTLYQSTKAFLSNVTDDLCIPHKASLKNFSSYPICQEYLTLLIALSFWKGFVLFSWLWWPHIVLDIILSFASLLCSFLCRLALFFKGIKCWSTSKVDACLPSHLTLSSLLSNVSQPKVPNTLIILMVPKVYLQPRYIYLAATWYLLLDVIWILQIQNSQNRYHGSPPPWN